MMATRLRSWAARTLLAVLVAGCFETRMRPSVGGETHFMRDCDDEGRCADGLSCVCGVCSAACDDDATCSELAGSATCMAVDDGAQACDDQGASVPVRACAAGCERDGDCAALGGGLVCAQGQCRERTAASAPPLFVDPSSGECTHADCMSDQPLVLLLVDTSGSMERKAECTCTTPACEECLPDCAAGERSRWIDAVEVLAGQVADYGCESLPRTSENGATFDANYFTPHHALRGVPGDDGLLDVYRTRVRFGLATFDAWDSYLGAMQNPVPRSTWDFEKSSSIDGLWSYNPLHELGVALLDAEGARRGVVHYPGSEVDYYVDTGVRGPRAEQGALRVASPDERADDANRPLAVNAAIQADLLVTRPYGGTPIAAALDDLYFYFALDPGMERERAAAAAKHVVLITDSEPDTDYREVGCACGSEGDLEDPYRCAPGATSVDPSSARYDPAMMHCPYPKAEDAAQQLRCGSAAACDGPVERVHVISFALDHPSAVAANDRIARGGGADEGARVAANSAELRRELMAVLEEIAAD